MLRLATVVVLCLETCLLFLVGFSLRLHKEWWVVLPIFAIGSLLLWLPFHIVYFVLNWKLWSRVSEIIAVNIWVVIKRKVKGSILLWSDSMNNASNKTTSSHMISWSKCSQPACILLMVSSPNINKSNKFSKITNKSNGLLIRELKTSQVKTIIILSQGLQAIKHSDNIISFSCWFIFSRSKDAWKFWILTHREISYIYSVLEAWDTLLLSHILWWVITLQPNVRSGTMET